MREQLLLNRIVARFSVVSRIEDDPLEFSERVALEAWARIGADYALSSMRHELGGYDDQTEPVGWAVNELMSKIKSVAFQSKLRAAYKDALKKNKAKLRKLFSQEAVIAERDQGDPDFARELCSIAAKVGQW